MVKLVIQDYKIVEKKETRVLLRTLEECRAIYNGWSVLSSDLQEELNDLLDAEIDKKLEKCYSFYERKYGVEIENGYGKMKDIEINLSNICEKIRSWEGE